MGIVLPEIAVRDTLVAGENLILSDLDLYLADILEGRPADEIARLKRFYERGSREVITEEDARDVRDFRVKKYLGFPRAVQEMPAWAIVVQSSDETQRAIGGFVKDDEGNQKEVHGSIFKTRVAIHCYTTNAELTIHLQAVARWILLAFRDSLNSQFELFDQSISASDFQAPPDHYPELTFVRTITFSCSHLDTHSTSYETILGINIADEIDGVEIEDVWKNYDGSPLGS